MRLVRTRLKSLLFIPCKNKKCWSSLRNRRVVINGWKTWNTPSTDGFEIKFVGFVACGRGSEKTRPSPSSRRPNRWLQTVAQNRLSTHTISRARPSGRSSENVGSIALRLRTVAKPTVRSSTVRIDKGARGHDGSRRTKTKLTVRPNFCFFFRVFYCFLYVVRVIIDRDVIIRETRAIRPGGARRKTHADACRRMTSTTSRGTHRVVRTLIAYGAKRVISSRRKIKYERYNNSSGTRAGRRFRRRYRAGSYRFSDFSRNPPALELLFSREHPSNACARLPVFNEIHIMRAYCMRTGTSTIIRRRFECLVETRDFLRVFK